MSDLRLVYLSGEPGIGKSTLMREITANWERIYLPQEPGTAPHRDLLFDRSTGRAAACEVGRIRDSFSGTDALANNCITEAEAWLASGKAAREAPLILGEGARLANRRFLSCAVGTGWQVHLFHLQGASLAAHRRSDRARTLGTREQNPSWVKGRRTAAANLALTAHAYGVTIHIIDAARIQTDHAYHDTIIDTARGSHPASTPR